MIEEAAGTRMYESKRLSAQKTIDKKAIKLTEIDTVSCMLYISSDHTIIIIIRYWQMIYYPYWRSWEEWVSHHLTINL